MNEINHLAVIVAVLSAFLIGGLWYSPLLFAKPWMAAAGISEEQARQAKMAKVFGISFIWVLLGAYVFAMFLGPDASLGLGAGAGFAAGLFWVAGSFAVNYQFEQRPLRLLLINGGYHTVQYTVIGLILAAWP
ncbi:DUF1761 domain-containing protein [Haliea sp. E1-2-M8]|uniref:DUF1761 domain-containing protein n=1 Tax=Haliea sp. E1-2-M8 TaxID=3064706 RepID=UPI002719E8BB|nr:DUF1761 domain-containing protein [Haliea sp. E1-2-M8]MDO8861985.1 DUF1761 domain-containing protein [Haliea sp. E1-2-M8]